MRKIHQVFMEREREGEGDTPEAKRERVREIHQKLRERERERLREIHQKLRERGRGWGRHTRS